MKEIVLTDGSVVNDYGFRVRTSGIILSRFLKNPVMLNDHCRELDDILGRWENVREEGLQLIGTPIFNSDDPEIKLIADAYEKGFINAASIGYDFDEEDFELMPDGIWELTKCILYEVSLVSIPSNDSAVCLYSAKTKKRVTKEEFKTLSAQFIPNQNRKENRMAKMVLSAGLLPLLGLTMQENEVEVVETAIKNLSAKLESAEGKLSNLSDEVETYKKKELEAKKLAAKTLVDKAEADGKILAKDKAQFVEMAETNFQLASNVLGAMPSRNVLSAKQQRQAGGQAGQEQEETYDYLSKHNPTRLASIKASDPERFAVLESAYLASKK